MDGNLEFRVLVFYLGAMYVVSVIYWRKSRRLPAVVGVGGERQGRARLVASAFFAAPLVNFLVGGVWPWDPELSLPPVLRWSAAMPATLAVLLLVWACGSAASGRAAGTDGVVEDGPYRWIRHPQLLASSLFFLALAVLTSNGVVLISTILGVLLLVLVVAPAVEADLEEAYGKAYVQYRQRTGGFFFPLRRIPQAQYMVPRRFGLSAVLALTTIFACVFGVLNFWEAPPVVYLFVATEISAICLVQIVLGSAARSSSAITGAVLLPFWTVISVDLRHLAPFSTLELTISAVILVLVGALLGYCIGGIAAGFFLAMDMLEPYLPGAKADSHDAIPPNSDRKPG